MTRKQRERFAEFVWLTTIVALAMLVLLWSFGLLDGTRVVVDSAP